jgi:hypothetical protein
MYRKFCSKTVKITEVKNVVKNYIEVIGCGKTDWLETKLTEALQALPG